MSEKLPTGVYVEPRTRTWTDWTPERIRSAERQADGGNLLLAADLCEQLLADDRVQGVLKVRTYGLTKLPISFEDGTGPAVIRRRAVRALQAQEDWFSIAPENVQAQISSWGIMLGVCPVQKVWQTGPKGRPIPVLDQWNPRYLQFADGQWTIDTQEKGRVPVERGMRWAMYLPFGPKRPWLQGAWRAVSRWWLLKQYAQNDVALAGQNAAGIRTVTTPKQDGPVNKDDSRNDIKRKQLAQELSDMGRRASLALPPGWDLKLVQASASTHAIYEAQINLANSAIAIALAGQNLTSEVTGGSYAAADVHRVIGQVLIAGDAEAQSTFYHDDVLGDWAAYNFGASEIAPWPTWDTSPPEDLKARAETMSATARAITDWDKLLYRTGNQVDVLEFARQQNIPLQPLPQQPDTATGQVDGGGQPQLPNTSPTTSTTGS